MLSAAVMIGPLRVKLENSVDQDQGLNVQK